MSDIEQLIERVIGCAFEEGENDRDYIGGHTSELKIAKSNLLSSIAKHETQLAEYRAVIVALWPKKIRYEDEVEKLKNRPARQTSGNGWAIKKTCMVPKQNIGTLLGYILGTLFFNTKK